MEDHAGADMDAGQRLSAIIPGPRYLRRAVRVQILTATFLTIDVIVALAAAWVARISSSSVSDWQQLFWFRQGYDAHKEPQPKLKITGCRLDAPASPLLADPVNSSCTRPDEMFMIVGINFPTLGCWEIKGQHQDAQVTYVVWVTK